MGDGSIRIDTNSNETRTEVASIPNETYINAAFTPQAAPKRRFEETTL